MSCLIWVCTVCIFHFVRFFGVRNVSAFDIFQKVVFCVAFYTDEVNLQTFVLFNAKPFVVTTYAQKVLF